jgi:GTP cyclohydrolase I
MVDFLNSEVPGTADVVWTKVTVERLAGAMANALHVIPGEDETRQGLERTPIRWAVAMAELLDGYETNVEELVARTFDEDAKEMVIVKDIPFYSLCEHHVLPFSGVAHVGYIPRGKVLGLSKIARVVRAYAHRLQVQERMTEQVAAALEQVSPDVMVVVTAEHLCMTMRGIQVPGAQTVTSAVRGVFGDDKDNARAEFLALVQGGR